MYGQAPAPDIAAARRWAAVVREEINRLGLGERPVFDPFDPATALDVTIDPFEPYDSFDDVVGDGIACTATDGWRH